MLCAQFFRYKSGHSVENMMLVAALAWPAVLGVSTKAVDKYVLDLTSKAVEQARAELEQQCEAFTGSGGASSAPRPQTGLALQLVSLQGNEFRLGDEVVAEVRLTNVESSTISIPWNWDRRTIYTDYCFSKLKELSAGWSEGDFSLLFTDKFGHRWMIALPSLYAALGSPGSYRVLRRGESAVIRAPARLSFTGGSVGTSPDQRLELPQELGVSATFNLQTSSQGWYKEVRSTGSIKVKVIAR